MATQHELIAQMQEFEDNIEGADKAIALLLEMSGVHPDVREAIYRLIELRSEAAEYLSRTAEALYNMSAADVIVFEVVEYGIPA